MSKDTHQDVLSSQAFNAARLGFMELKTKPALNDQFLAPAMNVLDNFTRNKKECSQITDADFLRLGCQRVLSQARSGRDFLQQQQELFDEQLGRSSFFAALHSRRRRDLTDEVSLMLYLQAAKCMAKDMDLLGAFPELSARQVAAIDGHQIEHACHALRDAKGRHVGSKNLYALCLHSGLMHNLGAVQGDGRYRHEMPVLRQYLPAWLRGLNPSRSAKPPILVLDPAFVDNQFWLRMRWLRESGAVMITRMKENMKPEVYSALPWEPEAEINLGIKSDCLVGFAGGGCMRRIVYADPETNQEHVFLTTEQTLPPGLIAWLYLLRWRIEKVFDTGKNKLQEVKAWATGDTAREIQGHFFAITHNLLVLFSRYLQSEHGLKDDKLQDKRSKALESRRERARQQGRRVHPLHWKMPALIQLSLQFIRTLRNYISSKTSLPDSLPRFNVMLTSYL